MNSRIRHSSYTAGAVVLLLCFTGVSVPAQQAVDGPLDRTVVKQPTDGKLNAAVSSAFPSKNPAADPAADPAAKNAKQETLDATRATPNENSASSTAPVSFLVPRTLPPGEHLTPKLASSSVQGTADKWVFTVAPYLWMAGISGPVGVGDITTDIDPSFSSIFDALNFGFMGVFVARKNRFMLVTDLMYLSLEETKSTPGPLFSALNAESKTFMLSPVFGYRVLEKEGASLDAIVGIRFWHTSTRLELEPRLLAGRVAENSKNWADVIGGLRGQFHLTRIFSLIGRGDLGGGGSDFTYQLFGAVGIDVHSNVSLVAGYRYLFIKYTRENFLFDGAFKGPVLGAEFRF